MSLPYGLNAIVYSKPKRGKSWLGDTTPPPRLILDAEGGSFFTPSKKIIWDPSTQKPPTPDGTWESALVTVHDYRTVLRAYEWLNSGQHPFRSVVLDSVSEIQQRAVDNLVGINQMQVQDWGTLLRQVSDLVRKFRDLTSHPVRPLDAVLFIAMAQQMKDESWRPRVQGALSTTLPHYVDVCAYLELVANDAGEPVRRLFIGPRADYETGERVGGRLGDYIDNPNIATMIRTVRGESTESETTA